jgi:hypothetical protein
MSQELVSTAWSAETLGCSTATVRRLVTSGDLTPAAKGPGERGGYLFRMSDVIRLATKRAAT